VANRILTFAELEQLRRCNIMFGIRKDRRGETAFKGMIMILLLVVVGVALFTTVVVSSNSGANATTDTGQKSMMHLVPMLFILVIIVGAFVVLIKSLDII
jgi:uncharacterized BrkB/YihY/UPF0761 family membrane protein